jgi:phage replication-related protein YjqB (UPF0714/DUF867 family)
MGDKYGSFAEMAANEPEGKAWTREWWFNDDSDLSHIAIHGGGIEQGTTEAARAGACGTNNYFSLLGKKASGNGDLHVTSTHFDEPNVTALQARMVRTVSWHGYAGAAPATMIGGLDDEFIRWARLTLTEAGFNVATTTADKAGRNPANICNRNLLGKGLQLEISTGQRSAWFKDNDPSAGNRGNTTPEFDRYVNAIRIAYRRMRA